MTAVVLTLTQVDSTYAIRSRWYIDLLQLEPGYP